MRPLSREVLARDAASRLAVATMPEGHCSGHGEEWTQLELRHRRASVDQAEVVIEEVRRAFCDGCPARLGCAQWASVQQYTGLAAGAAYEQGERQDPDWSVPRNGRRRKAS